MVAEPANLASAPRSSYTTLPVVLIPAYKPTAVLPQLVNELADSDEISAVVIVNDGSGPSYRDIFVELSMLSKVEVLTHAINMGKGAALKTALNFAACHFPETVGVITADADGQHTVRDIRRIAECLVDNPGVLVLGTRQWEGNVPLRSRFGNSVTRTVVRLFIGQRLADTQTGLRGIPTSLIPQLLTITSNRYEFELDMLITAKHHGYRVFQQPIETIYLNGNSSSHFNPIFDSMKIYFVLLRFGLVSLLTAVLDNLMFFVAYQISSNVAVSQVVGRTVALLFNYTAARKAVFLSRERHAATFPRYVALVVVSGVLSYSLIELILKTTGAPVMTAKIVAETLLFLANFAVQRDFVFTKRKDQARSAATDWTNYYRSVPPTAKITRRYTIRALLKAFRYAGVSPDKSPTIIEIGGANSCFLDRLLAEFHPSEYHIVDTNEFGLSLLYSHRDFGKALHLHRESVLELPVSETADAVFSVGLIEHFDEENTRAAVEGHFRLARSGGVVLISFPHPTLLYRLTRALLETFGLWKFPDERPLSRQEVVAAIEEHGEVLYQKILWPLMLTQLLIVARKDKVPGSRGANLERGSSLMRDSLRV